MGNAGFWAAEFSWEIDDNVHWIYDAKAIKIDAKYEIEDSTRIKDSRSTLVEPFTFGKINSSNDCANNYSNLRL